MDALTSTRAEPGPNRDLVLGWMALGIALAPALSAIAWVPEFATQDGPAHLYNASILNASLGSDSPFSGTFEVAWQPLPNWTGHLGTMALLAVWSPSVAGRVMTGLTLVVFAVSVVWLRQVVAGSKGLASASVLAALLAMNVTWLLGFTSFLLGASLMPATLAVWWGGRECFGATRTLGLSALLVLGYFCHPISLGLTVVGLGLLAVLTPGPDPLRRGSLTLFCLAPLLPLGLAYWAMTRSGGALKPVWEHLSNPLTLGSWASQIGWIDPLSLAAKTYRPFSTFASRSNAASSPAIWTGIAVGLLMLSTWGHRAKDRRGWLALAVLLILGGVLGPDTLGVKHGHYLPQRVALLGLVALVPWLDLASSKRTVALSSGLLVVALLIQSAFVWDYAFVCEKKVGSLLKASSAIGTNQRVGTLLVGIRGRFRANPILHADCFFGLEEANVIWNNYETEHYYFPVKIRPGLDHPPAMAFEQISILNPVTEVEVRARLWEAVLDEHGQSIDRLVEWSESIVPQLEAINRRHGYEVIFRDGPVSVWSRRGSD